MFKNQMRSAAALLALTVGIFAAGCGSEKYRNDAEKQFLKAAKKGDAEAQYNLGACYEFGGGASVNADLARQWYEKAAAQGHKKAKARLRILNAPKSPTEDEAKELRKAALKRDPDPKDVYRWAECCEFGYWTEKDRDRALRFYSRAAGKGFAPAKERAEELAEELSPSEAEVKKFRAAARKGNAEAQYQFARCLEFGFHVKRNIGAARELYRRAADQGHPGAMKALGRRPKQPPRKPANKRKR